jgi:hypothetical protein
MAAPITTYHYDNGRTGWNRHETILTPANVGNLQLLNAVALDEKVNAQPPLVRGRHSVVYVATANNTIYARRGHRRDPVADELRPGGSAIGAAGPVQQQLNPRRDHFDAGDRSDVEYSVRDGLYIRE